MEHKKKGGKKRSDKTKEKKKTQSHTPTSEQDRLSALKNPQVKDILSKKEVGAYTEGEVVEHKTQVIREKPIVHEEHVVQVVPIEEKTIIHKQPEVQKNVTVVHDAPRVKTMGVVNEIGESYASKVQAKESEVQYVEKKPIVHKQEIIHEIPIEEKQIIEEKPFIQQTEAKVQHAPTFREQEVQTMGQAFSTTGQNTYNVQEQIQPKIVEEKHIVEKQPILEEHVIHEQPEIIHKVDVVHNQSSFQQGMPQQGMPQQGMPQQGMHQQGMHQQGMHQQGMHQQGMHQQGFHQQGMHQQGLPQQGLPQQGLPQQGLPQQGLPQHQQGKHKKNFDNQK